MTAGVYGLVAAIVKLDDGGLYLARTAGPGTLGQVQKRVGETILKAAPYLMRLLTVAGTIAMFLVGGGILTHGIPAAHDWIHHLANGVAGVPTLIDAIVGIVAGGATLLVVTLAQGVKRRFKSA
jgi:predicted DNA repair protein MutK